jgi:hypothetical protein
MNVELLHLNIGIKPPVMTESVMETQIIYTLQRKNLTTRRTHHLQDLQVPPIPSARIPCNTSLGYLWVTHTLSRYTSLQEW